MSGPDLTEFDGSVLIYGCGTMAGAMLSRWLTVGLDPGQVTALRHSGAGVGGGVRTVDSARGLAPPDILLIGVKPQVFPGVADDIAALASGETLVVSIMAGVTVDQLRVALPNAAACLRVMPNMPVAHGDGVVVRIGDAGGQSPRIAALLAPLGHVETLDDEMAFDAVTALTGCGPAFVYRVAAALGDAGVALGLDAAAADRLARATLAGAAGALTRSSETPHAMAAAVASPGGMTQAGLDVLDADGRLTDLLAETLRAARNRGQMLAAAAQPVVGG